MTRAQDVGVYSNRMVFSGFVEYSNDSSHMLLGYADGRKITALGASFERRSFLGSNVTGSWVAEVRPVHDCDRSYDDRLHAEVSATACVFGNREFCFARSGG